MIHICLPQLKYTSLKKQVFTPLHDKNQRLEWIGDTAQCRREARMYWAPLASRRINLEKGEVSKPCPKRHCLCQFYNLPTTTIFLPLLKSPFRCLRGLP